MRFAQTSLVALAIALVITGCGGKSSSSSDSSGDQTSAAASSAPAAKAVADIPSYPGAATQAAGSGSNMGTSAAGKVLSTGDSFDKVYGWYQQNMPSGSEKSHVDAPVQSAVFMIGDTGTGQSSVTLTTSGGKTIITIAHVKM
ncbi:MAG TPA: hypothetical protein VEW74_03015 [Candidatus Nitrosotalea sp.]|nr:hypothetical protein [Candidatus Nitrosotalea sp.]